MIHETSAEFMVWNLIVNIKLMYPRVEYYQWLEHILPITTAQKYKKRWRRNFPGIRRKNWVSNS